MTGPALGRGRGRPSLFTADRQTAYLDLVAAGIRLQTAAEKIGMDPRRILYAKTTQPAFAHRLTEAKAAGRRARANPSSWPHGHISTYNNHGCRCARCRKAAARVRAAAPDRQPAPRREPAEPEGATLHTLPTRATVPQPIANAS